MTKYEPLRAHLAADGRHRIELSFTELDALVGGLPPSALRRLEWWSNNDDRHPQARAWLDAGYRASASLTAGRVVFEKGPNGL